MRVGDASAGGQPAPPAEGRPRDESFALFEGPLDVRSVALTGLLVLALVAAMRVGRTLLVPVVLAMLASFTLAPVVAGLVRLRIPRALAAALTVVALLAVLGGAGQLLYEPASDWVRNAPARAAELERRMRSLREPIEQVEEASEAVGRLSRGKPDGNAVTLRAPSALPSLFAQTGALLVSGVIVTVLLYFLLATGDVFLRRLVQALPRFRDKRRAVEIIRAIETDVSRYLLTISVINALLGVLMAAAMALLEMPSPILWGAMAAVLNFVPVLGALCGTGVVAGVAILTFDSLSHALLVPLCFAAVTGLEGMLLTPAILGQRLRLNPVVVFLGLLAGSWLWGIAGALVAVPLLVVLKILFDRVDGLRAVGLLIER